MGWGTIPGISFANWNSSVQKRCTLSGYVTEIQYIKWDLYVVLLYFVIPLLQWSWKGVYWFHLCRSLCQSIYLNPCGFVHTKICPFWTKSCLLCFFHNTCGVNFIFIHLIKQLQKACHVLSSFFQNSKNLTLTLSCVHVLWMLKLISHLSFYHNYFKLPVVIPLDGLLHINNECC